MFLSNLFLFVCVCVCAFVSAHAHVKACMWSRGSREEKIVLL